MLRSGSAVIGAVAMLASSAGAQTTVVQPTPAAVLAVQKPAEVVSGSALPSNSDVWVSMDGEVSSKKLKKERAEFPVSVSRDVMLGNYVVIPRGTHGRGMITYRTGKGAFGKSAKMEFDIVDVTLPGGRVIPLAGHYRIEGSGNTGAAVGAVVAVGVFGAFVTGRSAVAAQGSEWKASTKEPLVIAVADGPGVPAGAPANAQPAVVTATPPVTAPK
jgi:hypothetical protein